MIGGKILHFGKEDDPEERKKTPSLGVFRILGHQTGSPPPLDNLTGAPFPQDGPEGRLDPRSGSRPRRT